MAVAGEQIRKFPEDQEAAQDDWDHGRSQRTWREGGDGELMATLASPGGSCHHPTTPQLGQSVIQNRIDITVLAALVVMLFPGMGCDGAYLLLQATGRNFSCMNWSFSALQMDGPVVVQAHPAVFFMLTKHGFDIYSNLCSC